MPNASRLRKINIRTNQARTGTVVGPEYRNAQNNRCVMVIWDDLTGRGPVEQLLDPVGIYTVRIE